MFFIYMFILENLLSKFNSSRHFKHYKTLGWTLNQRLFDLSDLDISFSMHDPPFGFHTQESSFTPGPNRFLTGNFKYFPLGGFSVKMVSFLQLKSISNQLTF
jgi:hypothetical protein